MQVFIWKVYQTPLRAHPLRRSEQHVMGLPFPLERACAEKCAKPEAVYTIARRQEKLI